MMPGMPKELKDMDIDEKQFDRIQAIIFSMTKEEREKPSIINVRRRQRIAKGCGQDIKEVNRLIKQFEESKKMMKQMTKMSKGGKKGRRGQGQFQMPMNPGKMKFPF